MRAVRMPSTSTVVKAFSSLFCTSSRSGAVDHPLVAISRAIVSSETPIFTCDETDAFFSFTQNCTYTQNSSHLSVAHVGLDAPEHVHCRIAVLAFSRHY